MHARGGRARRGFTLIELLIVISLIALILGLGVGVLARIDLGDRVASTLVENVIRTAHNHAVAQQAPARVRINTKDGSVRAEGLRVIGTWHFEALPIQGAFDVDGAHLGGRIVEDGFQGNGLSFIGEPARSRVEIPIEKNSEWELAEGFAVQCAVRATAERGGALLQIGESAGLDVGEDGSLKGWITVRGQDDLGQEARGGRVPLVAPAGTLAAGRWTQVEFQYDRRRLRLFADRVLVAEVAEEAPVWRVESPLVISPGHAAFPGAIDNLVVSVASSDEASVLPKNARFAAGSAREIVFAAGGGLDREMHREPVKLFIELDDGRQLPIVVNLYGTIE